MTMAYRMVGGGWWFVLGFERIERRSSFMLFCSCLKVGHMLLFLLCCGVLLPLQDQPEVCIQEEFMLRAVIECRRAVISRISGAECELRANNQRDVSVSVRVCVCQ